MRKEGLNSNDQKLIVFCEKPRYVVEIAKFLGIAEKNVYVRLDKLQKAGFISVKKGAGKKTYVTAINKQKIEKYILEILNLIKQRGGEVTSEEFALFPFYNPNVFSDPNGYQKQSANNYVLWSSGFVTRRIKLTPEGEAFLKQHSKKNG